MLLQDGKDGPNYFDPIYDKDAKPTNVSEMEEKLVDEMVLSPTDDLETILNGRVRGGKKEEGGYRGYPTLERRGQIEEEGIAEAELKAVEASEAEQAERAAREEEMRKAEEGTPEGVEFDAELFEETARVYGESLDMEPEQAVEHLMSLEAKLSKAIKEGGDVSLERDRQTIRDMIATRDAEMVEKDEEGGTVGGYYPQKGLFEVKEEGVAEGEQATIPGAEEFQVESRLADDEAKLKMIRSAKAKAGHSGAAKRFVLELGRREAELIKSIADQKQGEQPEQKGMFGEAAAPEEETGGTVGGFFGKQPPAPPGTPPGAPPTQIDPNAPVAGEKETPKEAYDAMKKVMVSSEDLLDSDKDKRTYPQIMRDLVKNMQTDYVSRYTPFRDMQRALLARIGQSLPTMDLATMFEQLAGIESKAKHDVIAFRIEVIDPIKKYKKEFESYIAFKRTEDRLTFAPKTKKVGDWTVDRARKGLRGLKEEVGEDMYELFVETGEKFQKHMTKMLESMVTSGLITPEDFEKVQGDTDFYAFFKVAKYFTEQDLR